MSKTQADLIETILQNLGVVAVGQPVQAEDSSVVSSRLEPKNAELNSRQIGYISDFEDIPDEVFLAYATVMADECAPLFGVTGVNAQMLAAQASRAEKTIRDISRAHGTNQMLRCDPMLNWGAWGYGGRRV